MEGFENLQTYHDMLTAHKIVMAYGGEIKNGVVPHVMNIIDRYLESELNHSLRRRVLQVAVECIQNIEKHGDQEGKDEKKASFLMFKKDKDYLLSIMNRVHNKNVPLIREKIEKVNSLNKEALTEYYKRSLRENSISEKGGAGLGLIEISRKSGNKLSYAFDPVDQENSNFSLTITVS